LKKNGIFVILSFFLVTSSFGISYVEAAPTVTVYTDKDTYSFGEYLSITIDVSEVTGDHAVLVIRDEFGKGSTPIEIPITGLKTIMPSPYPFDPIIYVEGKYYVDVEYSGSTGSTEFNLIDSGNIVIPFWIKDLARYWLDVTISDNDFAKAIEFLIKEGIIVVPETQSQNDGIRIPDWIKTNTKWWVEGKISDDDYALGLEYLIKIGVIVV